MLCEFLIDGGKQTPLQSGYAMSANIHIYNTRITKLVRITLL